ncbi:MAG: TetR/AcrR family transcriptional regulator [Actinobacteria bacterium]|nr:TetR/AcrR family transcriptional regulator [Actinomycetota bacterium]
MLDAALSEFAERGFHAASIEDIAARAGVTKGAVYYWFRDKEDLAADLQHGIWERLGREANAAIDPDATAPENLKRALRAFLAALDSAPEARFFLRDCWAVPALDAAGRSDQESGVAMVRALLEGGVTRGELAPVDTEAAARLLLGAFAEATIHILTTGKAESTVEVVERMIDGLVRVTEGAKR